jgi:hypothetical protein
MVHTCNPRTHKAEAGKSRVQTLSQKKNKKLILSNTNPTYSLFDTQFLQNSYLFMYISNDDDANATHNFIVYS